MTGPSNITVYGLVRSTAAHNLHGNVYSDGSSMGILQAYGVEWISEAQFQVFERRWHSNRDSDWEAIVEVGTPALDNDETSLQCPL